MKKSGKQSNEKRLADALEKGLVFGLDRAGNLSISDPKQGLDGLDQTWWGTQNWSAAVKESFTKFLIVKLQEAPNRVLIGDPNVLDRINGISQLSNNDRADWYRKNLFDQPIQEAWPREGLKIREAVLVGKPLDLELSDETMERLVGNFLATLMDGFFVASGVIGRKGKTRIPIPTSEFKYLHLGAWRYDIIKDEIDRIYSKVRIHSPDNLPPELASKLLKTGPTSERRPEEQNPLFKNDEWIPEDWVESVVKNKESFPNGAVKFRPARIGKAAYDEHIAWWSLRKLLEPKPLNSKIPFAALNFNKRASQWKKRQEDLLNTQNAQK